jgi:hypothetical protein
MPCRVSINLSGQVLHTQECWGVGGWLADCATTLQHGALAGAVMPASNAEHVGHLVMS